MENCLVDSDGLTSSGAKLILNLLEKRPELRNRMGKTTWADKMHHSKNLTEIDVETIRKVLNLDGSIETGSKLSGLIANVTDGFIDYGDHAVCLDLNKIRLLANQPKIIANSK